MNKLKALPQQTVIQTSVAKEHLSTVYTSLGAIGTGIFGVGSLFMGLLADLLEIRIVFMIPGILLAVVLHQQALEILKNDFKATYYIGVQVTTTFQCLKHSRITDVQL